MKFLIVGSGRCGTTFLREMLNRHPDTYVINESYWHPSLLAKYGYHPAPASDILHDISNICFHNGVSTLGTNLAEIGETLDAFMAELLGNFGNRLVPVGAVFAAIEAAILRRVGKRIYAEKTPHYGCHLPALKCLWPELKVVHIVRDGRECAVSMRQHEGFQILAELRVDDWSAVAPLARSLRTASPSVTDLGVYLDMWARNVEQTAAALRCLPPLDWIELRYEDLLRTPACFFRRLTRFLGLGEDPDWVAACVAQVKAPGGATAGRGNARGRQSVCCRGAARLRLRWRPGTKRAGTDICERV